MAESVVFWILAPISLGAAIAMVLMRNAVHSALMLVLNFFTIAVFYAVLEGQFLAVVQVIVYAGAIMVLFLFVLMLLGVHRDAPLGGGRIRGQGPAALGLGALLLLALAVAVVPPLWGSVCPTTAEPAAETAQGAIPCLGLSAANAEGNVAGIGALLFTRYVWPFEVTSALLVIAAIGAIVLGRRREDPADLVDLVPAGGLVRAHVQATGAPPPDTAPAPPDAEAPGPGPRAEGSAR